MKDIFVPGVWVRRFWDIILRLGGDVHSFNVYSNHGISSSVRVEPSSVLLIKTVTNLLN